MWGRMSSCGLLAIGPVRITHECLRHTLQSQSSVQKGLFAVSFVCALALCAQKKPITLETLTQTPPRRDAGGTPIWAPDGKRFAYLKGRQIMLYDVPSKSEKELLSLEPLEKAAVPAPERERFDWQNRRVSEDRVQWSDSGKELLLEARGDLFIYHLDSGKWDQLTATPEPERDAKLSPDAAHAPFLRGPAL